MKKISLLDCTLRDGAYIVNGNFGDTAIKGIVSKLAEARVDIVECGWLKDPKHISGSTYFHVPDDIGGYINKNGHNPIYVAMIDWDRYDLENLPPHDGRSIDAIRVVFPHNKHKEGIRVASQVIQKGYKAFLQAANTLAYSNDELVDLAREVNSINVEGLSVVDTFGAMYEEDLDRIVSVLDKELQPRISLGFHSHNNQQLAFSNAIHFIKILQHSGRSVIIDSSLCGMGRGAGNATTELMVNYLNNNYRGNYDFDSIMDAIDIYISGFQQKYSWGYSTAYCIAGIYCCHVNNIAYLQDNHRTNSKDMRNIIESLSPESRKSYDYDLLEGKYIENQNRLVDDAATLRYLAENIKPKVLLIAPGKSSIAQKMEIDDFSKKNDVTIVAVNALLPGYTYDYLFLTNSARYEYASVAKKDQFCDVKKLLLSSIKTEGNADELIIGFNNAIKRGWEHFDNAVMCCLRVMYRIGIRDVYLTGFDGFKNEYNESYADEYLPTLNPEGKWQALNDEIKDMYEDFRMEHEDMNITFITNSIFTID